MCVLALLACTCLYLPVLTCTYLYLPVLGGRDTLWETSFLFVVLRIRNEPREVTEKCTTNPLHNLPSLPHVIKVSKWERMKWEWRLLRVRESKRRILQGKPGYRQQDNFTVNVRVIGSENLVFAEYDNEPSVFTKGEEFFDYLSGY